MKVSDKVVQRLRLLIEKNNVQVGERLPAERQLCEQLGVSRSSLREAIQQLITAGIIQSKAGAGTYLKQLPAHWSQHQIVEPLFGLIDQDLAVVIKTHPIAPSIIYTSFLPTSSRSKRPFWKPTFRRMKNGRLTLRSPYCLSVASLRALVRRLFFKSVGRLGLDLLVTFGAMPKVTTSPFLNCSKFSISCYPVLLM